MPETEIEAKAYTVKYICDECHEGEMNWDGIYPFTYPSVEYQHICTKCGAKQMLNAIYPTTRIK